MDEGGGASRTTDPAAGTSSATDVSLREYLTSLIQGAERRADARFEAMQRSVDAAFSASQLAIDKANEATEKRFQGVNEFRAQLADQAGSFVSRQTVDALVEKLESQIDRNREDLDLLSKRIDVRQGELSGSQTIKSTLASVITITIMGLSLLVVVATWWVSSH